MAITKELLKALREDLTKAVIQIGVKYGVTLKVGNANYSTDSFTFKLEGLVVGGKNLEHELYEQNATWMGLPPYGSEVTIGRETYIVKGMKPRGKNSIQIERKKDGKLFVCAPIQLPKVKAAPVMPLAEFMTAVNAIHKAECDKANADKKGMFGAMFIPYTETMLSTYHKEGRTPAQTIADIEAEAEAEGRFEARAS